MTGTAEGKDGEGPPARPFSAPPSPSPPPFLLPVPWLGASLGRGPGPGTGQWDLEGEDVKGEVSALKVTLSCSSGSLQT